MSELNKILELHKLWLQGDSKGERADLTGADLRGVDLTGANLSEADLRQADLYGANLRGADLSGAYLTGADLEGANLYGANLKGANLRGADLYRANLRGANLIEANLSGANLRGANLSGADLYGVNLIGADLRGADLEGAYLSGIRQDFFRKLALAKNEVPGLYQALIEGKVNGSVYEGDCACFCGTIANIRGEHYSKLANTINLRPNSESPTEIWFLGILEGDTPETNQISKITCEWIEEFCKQEGLELIKDNQKCNVDHEGSTYVKLQDKPTVYFDVDDTLVMWWSDWSKIRVPNHDCDCIEFTDIRDGRPIFLQVHWTHVQALKEHKLRGHVVVVWSQGGADWAEEVVKKLNLESYVDVIVSKPSWYYDDLQYNEVLPNQSRRYIGYKKGNQE